MMYDSKWLKTTIEEETNLRKFIFLKLIALKIKGNERYPIIKFLISLRNYEYLKSKIGSHLFSFDRIRLLYWHYAFRHNQLKFNLYIEPFTVMGGAKIVHPGYRKIPEFVKIGANCTILPMVLFGKKKPGIDGNITVGKNCYISTGVTVIGPVNIGNNVTIGAGAVVTKDVPDDVTIAGVPARIIE